MIEVEKLTKRYAARTAVDDITFRVPAGEIVGFLGPNGAGKSTTLRMITGYLAPTSGRVRVDGIDVHDRPRDARRLIGYMPEGVPMYKDMRVHEYLRFRGKVKEIPRKSIADAVDRALHQADVEDAHDRVIGQLSKGYRQRVGLADALLADPPLLILDEPSSGLDPNQNKNMRDLIRSFERTKTVFLSTHILPQVENTCSRVIIIQEGRLVAEGAPEALRQQASAGRVVVLAGPGQRAAYEGALEGVEGVRLVEAVDDGADDGLARLRVTLTQGGSETDEDEAIDRVFKAVVDAGLTLREMVPTQASLESVFGDLTIADERDALIEDSAADDAGGEDSPAADADQEDETDEPKSAPGDES